MKWPELEIMPGVPMVLASTSKGDAMEWYVPEKYFCENKPDRSGTGYQLVLD